MAVVVEAVKLCSRQRETRRRLRQRRGGLQRRRRRRVGIAASPTSLAITAPPHPSPLIVWRTGSGEDG